MSVHLFGGLSGVSSSFRVIPGRFVFSGKNDELTPDFTQVEQDFNHVLLRGLGYTTQSDVASDQPWTLTPKWNVPGSGEVDAALGKFRLDESGWLSGEPLVRVELKGAKVDLDRKMPTRNITPVQQVCT